MRTKANEKKRYSLRTPRKMTIENDKSSISGSAKKQPHAIMSPIQNVKKTKRKGKPVKSATREEMESFKQSTPRKEKNNIINNFSEISHSSTSVHQRTPIHQTSYQGIEADHNNTTPTTITLLHEKQKITGKMDCVSSLASHNITESTHTTTIGSTSVTTATISKQNDSSVEQQPISNTVTDSCSASEKDVPVYTVLEHATSCKLAEKGCNVPKCGIAKQFLLHFASCTLKKDDCTICKAMDIMVCKHAEKCERALDKCCPIPNCDYVRKLMMGEWLKFRNNHHEIVTRAFSGLIHARKCKDGDCESVLCKNIKAVLLHTQTCKKKDECKTRKFVVQLCEYHQDTCENETCHVEFCVENRRIRLEDAARKQLEQQLLREKQEQFVHAYPTTKPVSNLNFNNIFFPNGLQGYINLQHMLNAASQPSLLVAGQQQPQQVGYPGLPSVPSLPLPAPLHSPALPPISMNSPLTHQSLIVQEPLTSSKDLRQQQQFHQQWNAHQDQFFSNYGKPQAVEQFNQLQWPHVQHYGPASTINNDVAPVQVSEANESQAVDPEEVVSMEGGKNDSMVASYPGPQQKRARYDGNICTSPTPDMYYQFLPMKVDRKEQLPRLSPNELQSILTRGESAPVLSPVHDHRAEFSEPPFLLNEFHHHNQNSQEPELEENPMPSPVDGDDDREEFPQCLGSADEPVDVDDDPEGAIHVNKMNEMMEQEAWSKIDFVKEQHLQQGYDIETETADETESENNIFESSPAEQRQPDSCYFVKNDVSVTGTGRENDTSMDEEDDDNLQHQQQQQQQSSSMTPLERNFLAILQSRQRDNMN